MKKIPRCWFVPTIFVLFLLILLACSRQSFPLPAADTRVNPVISSPPVRVTEVEPVETGATVISTVVTATATATIEPDPRDPIEEIFVPAPEPLTITVIYDNNSYDKRLKSDWGFSALVDFDDHILLFDTGGDGQILMENMRILGIDPISIESVVLSHAHGDHTSGLNALLEMGSRPTVYLLPSFPAAFKHQLELVTQVEEAQNGKFISAGFFSTGEIHGITPEQALVIKTETGLVIITGCAHPGIVEIIEVVRDMFPDPVLLAMGGFHLGSKSTAEIHEIISNFRRLEVQQVAPCHCTGDKAIDLFAAEYGENFIQVGVGRVIQFEVAASK
jgi:7,8-dihydropterin-6-yl-methyl-4-(beta-D-ribofuranosyl)aminobenzene 5'-phosphate synthase